MSLPPRANLVAVRHPDPQILGAVERAMRAHVGLRDDVWTPRPGWIAAAAPLPESEPEAPGVRAAGLAFGEGRDVVLAAAGPERVAALPPDRLAELPGDFTFVRFEEDAATAVRACGAGAPIHAGVRGERVAIATRLDLLVAVLDEPWRFDPLVAGTWMTAWALHPYARSLLAGMITVPRGHAAVLAPQRPPRLVRYWDPQPQFGEEPVPSPAHARELREELLGALERELDPAGRNLLTLSGGVDSSSLAALTLGNLRRGLSTLTVLSTDPGMAAAELPYIEALDERFGFTRRHVGAFDAAGRLELLHRAPAGVTPILHPALCMLPDIAREQELRVMIGGENADDVCGAALGLADWVDHTPPLALVRNLRRLPEGRRTPLRWAKWRAAAVVGRPRVPFPPQLPEMVHPTVRAEYAQWRRERQARSAAERRPRRYLALLGEHDGHVEMNWDVTTSLGIRRSFPFATRDLLERAFRWHPWELLGRRGSSRSKLILREALRDDVPALNLQRGDRGHHRLPGARGIREWRRPLSPALAGVVRDDWMAEHPSEVSFWEAYALTALALPAATLSRLQSARGR